MRAAASRWQVRFGWAADGGDRPESQNFSSSHTRPFVLSLSKDRHCIYTALMPFYTYMLRCNDGSYYTGHTDDLETRIAAHKSGAIAGYTSERLPVVHVWSEEFSTREEAMASERRIKGWSRAKKEALIQGDWDEIRRLARNRQDH